MESLPAIRVGLKILNCNDIDTFIANAPIKVPFLRQRSIFSMYKEFFKIFEGSIPENYPTIESEDIFEFQGFLMGVNDIQKYETFASSVTNERYRSPKISVGTKTMTIEVERIASMLVSGGVFAVRNDPQTIKFKETGIYITGGSCDGLVVSCGTNIQSFVIFCIFALQPSIEIRSILSYINKWRVVCQNR